jgi:mRNA interferase MazF
MKRGEVWTSAGGNDYAGKPRPVVILQDDRFSETASITICILTSTVTETSVIRPLIAPTRSNGLRAASQLMVDKVTTVPKTKMGRRIGQLDDADLLRLNQAVIVFLGLSISSKAKAD